VTRSKTRDLRLVQLRRTPADDPFVPLSTPQIPGCIRDFRHPSYTSIYQLCPGESRLFGTESLYGDWSAPLLLLAKDFAPARLVRVRIRAGDRRPYHHTDWRTSPRAPGAATNRNLHRFAESVPCAKLYGSALAGLLRNDDAVSGTLPDFQPGGAVRMFARDVLRFTLAHMPHLRAVVCLGVEAWDCMTESVGCAGADRQEHRNSRRPLVAGGIRIFALAHPSRFPPGGRETLEADWEAVRREFPEYRKTA
jgi:hypothetical protein